MKPPPPRAGDSSARARTATAAPVPASRAGRFASLALAAGEMALGGLAEGVRRLVAGGERPSASAFLTADTARRLAERLSKLRGGAMKLGQMLSLQGEDLLPPEFAQALSILRSQAAPMPPTQLRRLLGREYGKGWEARFEWFDFEPIAAASIGQVHRARAADGRALALKIQYPGVARSIKSDVENLASLLQVLKLLPHEVDIGAITAEVARQLGREADYLAEADALEHHAALLADERSLLLPRVHRDLTTARILALDFIDAEPLGALAADEVPQAVRDAAGVQLERLLFRELFEFGSMQSDPNFANYLWQRSSRRVVLLDYGSTIGFEPAFRRRFARITQATMRQDRDAVAREAAAIGYLEASDPAETVAATVDIILGVCEPLRHRGRYDFAASDLLPRLRAQAFELGVRRRLLRPPPPATIFLHRKLLGMFLVLSHIRARVDARALVQPLLEAALADAPAEDGRGPANPGPS